MQQTFALKTLGCKQNQFDTESLRRRLLAAGLRQVSSAEGADWFILNTCAVTEKALAKARGEINHVRRLQPRAKIVSLGCGARYQPRNLEAQERPIGDPFAGLISPSLQVGLDLCPPHGLIPVRRSRGLLRIQSGCNQACTFCIVPQVRGPSQSVPLEGCLQALKELLQQDAPEIVLTGTNVASWGQDIPGSPTLWDLLKMLVPTLGSCRLRLSSLEPHLISPEFLEWCLAQPQICRHFHFAFQSGSARLLQAMRREHLSGEFQKYIRELSSRQPDLCLGADIIVGFPGESDREFAETCRWVNDMQLSYLHVFPFSERIGTKAAALPGQVNDGDRQKRAAYLREMGQALKGTFIKRNEGISQEVIKIRSINSAEFEGLTSNYLRVTIRGDFNTQPAHFSTVLNGSLAATIAQN